MFNLLNRLLGIVIFIAFRLWLIYLLWIKLFLLIEKNIHSRWRLESSLIRKETKRNIDIVLSWALCILTRLAGFDAGHGTTNFSCFVYPDGGPCINKLWCWRCMALSYWWICWILEWKWHHPKCPVEWFEPKTVMRCWSSDLSSFFCVVKLRCSVIVLVYH